jgi:hypothetical protein
MISWPQVPGTSAYVIRWRPTDSNQWQRSKRLKREEALNCLYADGTRLVGGKPAPNNSMVCDNLAMLPHIRVDDWIFGVSSVGANGFESPVASAVPGGAFKPYVPPPPAPAGQ